MTKGAVRVAGRTPRLFPSKAQCCRADTTHETAMVKMVRGNLPEIRRAKQIHHTRSDAHFWHWSDVEVKAI